MTLPSAFAAKHELLKSVEMVWAWNERVDRSG
jgi:hypothetical protein